MLKIIKINVLFIISCFCISGLEIFAQCNYREIASNGQRYFSIAGMPNSTNFVSLYEDEDLDRARTFQLQVTVGSLPASITDRILFNVTPTPGYDWWVEISGPGNDFTNPTIAPISSSTYNAVPASGILNLNCSWPETIIQNMNSGNRSLRLAIGNSARNGGTSGQPSIAEPRAISNAIPINVIIVNPSASVFFTGGSTWALHPGGQLSFTFAATGTFKSYNKFILEAIDGPNPLNGVGLNWDQAATVSFAVPGTGNIGGYAPYLRKDGSKFASGTILHYRIRSTAPVRFSPLFSSGSNNGNVTAFENFTAKGMSGSTVLQTLSIGGNGSLSNSVHGTTLNYVCQPNPVAEFVFTSEVGAFGQDNYYVELLNPASPSTPPQILNCVVMPVSPNALVTCPTFATGMNCIFPILFGTTHVRINASLLGIPSGNYQIRVVGGRQYKRSIRIPVTISNAACRLAVDNQSSTVFPTQDIGLFPNPTHEGFKIELQDGSEEVFEIFGTDGKLVSSSRLTKGSAYVSTQNFGKGIYQVKINSKLGIRTAKLVVE